MDNNTPMSQEDILAANETLTANLAAVTSERNALAAQNGGLTATITALTSERDQLAEANGILTASVTALTKERDTLASENATLKAADKDLNARVAAELAKHGVRAEGVPAPSQGAGANGGADLVAQYQAMKDPTERSAFAARHAEALRKALIG